MARHTDTRLRVVDALDELLATHSIDSIRVSDVCRLSSISRTTFYVYFEDIYAVVQWVWDDLCSRSLYLINDTLSWREGHMLMLNSLLTRRAFFKRAFRSKDYQSLFSYGYRKSLITHIGNIERRIARQMTEAEIFELDYTIRSLSAMTTKWAEEGMDIPPEQIAVLFERFIPAFCTALMPDDAGKADGDART